MRSVSPGFRIVQLFYGNRFTWNLHEVCACARCKDEIATSIGIVK